MQRSEVRLLRTIGEGAFGEVSLASVPIYGNVAVKWLKPDRFDRHSQAFWREAQTLATLNHPNVLRFFGVVTEPSADGSPQVVGIMTEFVTGGSLTQFLR